ncbi:hypothetical protein Tco_0664340 [Tanacetum coccineum]
MDYVTYHKLERRKHYKYTYSSKQEDQIIQLADQRQHDDISNMAEVAEHKIQSEIQRFIMKLAIEMCMPKKRKYVDVMRSPYSGLSPTLNVPSIEQLANQKNDISRPFKRIDKIFLSHDLEEFLSSEDTHDFEFRTWYLKMRECLEEKLPVVLKETGVFEKKNIDPAKLAYGVLLAVDDPLQTALAYREK